MSIERPDIDAWRRYQDTDFDGLTWPVEELRKGADYIERLENGDFVQLYLDEGERVERLKEALEVCANHLDEIGETRMAKVARARAADA